MQEKKPSCFHLRYKPCTTTPNGSDTLPGLTRNTTRRQQPCVSAITNGGPADSTQPLQSKRRTGPGRQPNRTGDTDPPTQGPVLKTTSSSTLAQIGRTRRKTGRVGIANPGGRYHIALPGHNLTPSPSHTRNPQNNLDDPLFLGSYDVDDHAALVHMNAGEHVHRDDVSDEYDSTDDNDHNEVIKSEPESEAMSTGYDYYTEPDDYPADATVSFDEANAVDTCEFAIDSHINDGNDDGNTYKSPAYDSHDVDYSYTELDQVSYAGTYKDTSDYIGHATDLNDRVSLNYTGPPRDLPEEYQQRTIIGKFEKYTGPPRDQPEDQEPLEATQFFQYTAIYDMDSDLDSDDAAVFLYQNRGRCRWRPKSMEQKQLLARAFQELPCPGTVLV